MDTMLYDYSIPAISTLQSSLSDAAPFMELMSKVFDPKYAFLIYSPLAYLLDPKVGKKLIMTTAIAEWLNQILKWFLHGERPYWYVYSSGHFDPQQTPIKQFPITCELGPGHPSGHAMVTAAVWYVILSSLQQAYTNYQCQRQQVHDLRHNFGSQAATWGLYATLLAVVSVSRVFLGCHFPHQCLAGAALGLLVARYISQQDIKAMHYVGASLVLFATAFGTFGLLQTLGFDPSWTIKLATTHCVKREYIHLDTAPFFSIMRYCGFALGCGLGLLFPLKQYANQLVPVEAQLIVEGPATAAGEPVVVTSASGELYADAKNPLSSHNISWLSFKLVMAMLMARLVDDLGLFVSHANLPVFYSAAFAAYTLFSYAFTNL
ncbi:uncharacterized protein LOC129879811 [Solanum dulcamara]|uniref:uncharacterized protein LOC129879811 n=1 Tax=Solanum dulcamara TaxID=45834 RepID=UPI002485CDA4|nr:uncharacterized protein LOC129879811 [Solanum dulcamara]